MKKSAAFILYSLFFCICTTAQQVPSPEQFLGYPLGSHYTPHHKLIAYFKEVESSAPSMVKLEKYGETNEGRPLMVAYIGLPENLKRLDEIRLNNLRLANSTRDKMAPTESGPAIVWLSYNVHGNEPSSSEAAMKTLYELVNPANTQTKEWLKNLLIILDPCINPDGRDRYVNWFNSVAGKSPNPDPQSREHQEPWPGGRTNHYNFDLNRDWAWQTQIETQQRLKKYNSWLPQVHVDFHEQGYNSPYYFAPAAEPYHEVITNWQRNFQEMIGKNNAQYFDKNGWLYFTKERFDLFYPSYGDTYPMYNGAIGMTFEQGGHSRGGLAVINSSGDTLSLGDRLMHHFTTGMSTIEVASKNATQLISEFRKYFSQAITAPGGEFKSYLLQDPGGDKIELVKQLLDRNEIQYSIAPSGSFSGLNYFSGKTESFKTGTGDLLINANQPRSNLLRVLFERSSRISDSATYDITAWSVPFAYGIKTFGMNSYLAPGSLQKSPEASAQSQNAVAWIIPWKGMNSAKCLAALLQKGVKVRFTEEPFRVGTENFERGSLIIVKTSNPGFASIPKLIEELSAKFGVRITGIGTSFVDKGYDFGSSRVHLIHTPKVALLTGQGVGSLGAGEIWHFFEQQLNYPLTLLNAEDAARLRLKDYDVIILPDGFYKFLADKTTADQLKSWVRDGGHLIAMEGAVEQLAKAEFGIHLKGKETKKEGEEKDKQQDYSLLHQYGNREREDLAASTPGAIFKVELDNSHPLAFGYPDTYFTLKQDNTLYDYFEEGNGWNVGIIRKNNYVSGFAGSKIKGKIIDGLLFGVEESGNGSITYLTEDILFRSFWENGKLMFCNAVFFVGQ